MQSRSVVSDSATLWIVAAQAPLSVRFSRPEHWYGLPRSSPGGLPDPGMEPPSPVSPTLAHGLFTTSTTWEAQFINNEKSENEHL